MRAKLPVSWAIAMAATACLAVVLFAALNQAWGQLARFQSKARALQTSTAALADEIGRLRREIQALQSDPRLAEKHARRDYLYLKPDETLTVIRSEHTPP